MAAAGVGVSCQVGRRWFRDGGGMPTLDLTEPTGRYLSMAEREEIAILRAQVGIREIARRLKLSPATISRDFRRTATGGHPPRTRSRADNGAADSRARPPHTSKPWEHPPLRHSDQHQLACLSH